jgi:hypothetical protein
MFCPTQKSTAREVLSLLVGMIDEIVFSQNTGVMNKRRISARLARGGCGRFGLERGLEGRF